ncbi:MAG: zf-HC2 domain-containing protein [Acidobacteriia bacterium]|nr:zf-HC2 domain-containing protein [Terriglobia bacterium]
MGHHPKSCQDAVALLSDYVDFELPPAARSEVERHLAGCPGCLGVAEGLRHTIALCRAYEPMALPGPLSDRGRRDLEDAWRRMLAGRERPGPG